MPLSPCGLAAHTVAPHALAGACQAVVSPDSLLGLGKKALGGGVALATGHVGGAIAGVAGAVAGLGLSAIVSWVLSGAGSALDETAALLGKTTTPQLGEAWFSSAYLHMAAIATLLTLPFLFAAAVQAMLRSDLAMLARAALGYLPAAMLSIAIAAPVTALLLAASDGLSNVIEQAAGGAATDFLAKTAGIFGGLSVIDGSPFVAFLVGFFAAAGALVLWLELLFREVAVYVIVLTLPLVFAAFVWPARRIWAIRSVELLLALILSKVAIVAVLALGAGALDHGAQSASLVSLLAGVALMVLGLFAPWALVKLIPLGELAAAAAGPMRGHLEHAAQTGDRIATPWAGAGEALVSRLAESARQPDLGPDPTAAAPGQPERTAAAASGQPAPGEPAPGQPAPGEPGPADPPPGPPADGPDRQQNSRAERGPSKDFHGFPGAEDLWQADDETWAPDQLLGEDP